MFKATLHLTEDGFGKSFIASPLCEIWYNVSQRTTVMSSSPSTSTCRFSGLQTSPLGIRTKSALLMRQNFGSPRNNAQTITQFGCQNTWCGPLNGMPC
jgi:hypothetical protein